MYLNGIVIQKFSDIRYKGIDGSGFSENTGKNWYFNSDDELSAEFEPFYDKNIGKTYYDISEHSWVGACTDSEYIKKYISESKKRNIKFRLLLCESDIPEPSMKDQGWKRTFLGYDYAYAAGNYYSAVYNEIPFVFENFRLNENGLFETSEEIKKYVEERMLFEKQSPPLTLETGDFIIFRLSELIGSELQ